MNSDVKNDIVNNSQMPSGAQQKPFMHEPHGNPFSQLLSRMNNHQKVMNGGINGVSGDLIGRVVKDEKKDEQKVPESPQTEQLKVDTDSKQTLPKKTDEKNDISPIKDMVELEKLKYLQGLNKENKEKRRIDTKQGFENDYALIEDVKNGGYLYDILNDKRYINYNTIKNREFLEQNIGKLLSVELSTAENKYETEEKNIKDSTDDKREAEKNRTNDSFNTIKQELKTANGVLQGDLQNLVRTIMKGISYGEVDGKKCLKCSRGHTLRIANEIGKLIDKLQSEISSRKLFGKNLAQDSINEREEIKGALQEAMYKVNIIDVDEAMNAIEEDSNRVDNIYNNLNLFQRFWYAFVDLIFGTNYNQEYRDIMDLNRKMLETLQEIDNESDPDKKYEYIQKFFSYKSKVDNVRKNMATYLLSIDEKHKAVIDTFTQDVMKPTRAADDIVVKMFEICGGKKMSCTISNSPNNQTRKYIIELLSKHIPIDGVGDLSMLQRKEIISLALDGKDGTQINEKMDLIDSESETAKSDISALDFSVSGGKISSIAVGFTKKALNERNGLNYAMNRGTMYILEQKKLKKQIENYEKYTDNVFDVLDKIINNIRTTVLQDFMAEGMTGISMAKQDFIGCLQPMIMHEVDRICDALAVKAADKFRYKDEPDEGYNQVKELIEKEIEKLSSDELSSEDIKAGKKKSTKLTKIKTDKVNEMNDLTAILGELKSMTGMKKNASKDMKQKIVEKKDSLKKRLEQEFESYKKREHTDKKDAIQEHKECDKTHLDVYKNVENTKSKYGGRNYKELLEVLKNKGGRGGFPGMGMGSYF